MEAHGPLIRSILGREKRETDSVSMPKSDQKKHDTLVIDAISLYQEATQPKIFESLEEMLRNETTVHKILSAFFERFFISKQTSFTSDHFQIELIFSSIHSFVLNDGTPYLVDHEPGVIGTEPALYAWESISAALLKYSLCSFEVYFSSTDTFTALLQRAAAGSNDLCSRLICSLDPRFRCMASTKQVVTNICSAVLGIDSKFKVLRLDPYAYEPMSLALLRATDIAISAKILQIPCDNLSTWTNKAKEIKDLSKEAIDKWISSVLALKIDDKVEGSSLIPSACMYSDIDLKNALQFIFYSNCQTEVSRFRGTLAVCHRISSKTMAVKSPHPCQYHHTIPTSTCIALLFDSERERSIDSGSKESALVSPTTSRLFVSDALSRTKCFSRCAPIRDAFIKFCCCPSPPSLRAYPIVDVLRVTPNEPSSDSGSIPVLNPAELSAIRELKKPEERVVGYTKHLLNAVLSPEDNKASLMYLDSLRTSLSRKEREKLDTNALMEVQCSMLHVYLAMETCGIQLKESFPFLGEYI